MPLEFIHPIRNIYNHPYHDRAKEAGRIQTVQLIMNLKLLSEKFEKLDRNAVLNEIIKKIDEFYANNHITSAQYTLFELTEVILGYLHLIKKDPWTIHQLKYAMDKLIPLHNQHIMPNQHIQINAAMNAMSIYLGLFYLNEVDRLKIELNECREKLNTKREATIHIDDYINSQRITTVENNLKNLCIYTECVIKREAAFEKEKEDFQRLFEPEENSAQEMPNTKQALKKLVSEIQTQLIDKLEAEKRRLCSQTSNPISDNKIIILAETLNDIKKEKEKIINDFNNKKNINVDSKKYINDYRQAVIKIVKDIKLKTTLEEPQSQWVLNFWKPLAITAMYVSVIGIVPAVYCEMNNHPFFSKKPRSLITHEEIMNQATNLSNHMP